MAKKTVRKKATSRKRVKRNDFIVTKKQMRIAPLQVERETAHPVMNLDGNLLAGVLHEPVCKTNTLVIVMHGWTGSKEQTHVKQAAIDICRAGYATYRFDRSGNGDSEGRFEDAVPTKELHDVFAVVEHFRKQYAKVVLLGFSIGGTYAIITASHAKIDGVVTIAASVHQGWVTSRLDARQTEQLRSVGFTIIVKKRPFGEVPYTMTQRFVDEMKALDTLAAAKDVHCPVLVAHGTADDSVPVSESEELVEALYRKDFLLIGGASHNFSNPEHFDALVGNIIAWLRKHF